MQRNKFLISSVAALAIFNLQAFAEDTVLDNIEVSTSEVQVVSSSISVGQSAIETKQADHLSDLFRDIPGVDVGGSHAMNNKVIIRGVNDQDLAITIDGAKQPNVDLFHHFGTLKINPDILKKVNIEVGANSVIHGELGGAVEFETKDGKDFLEKNEKFGGMISATYNSNDSIGGSASLFGKPTDNSDFFAYYHYTNNENWKSGSGETQDGRDGEIDDILIKYGIDINDEQRISVSYDKMTDEGNYLIRPNFGSGFNSGVTNWTEYKRDTYTLKHSFDKGDSLLVNTTAYFNKMDLFRDENWTSRNRADEIEALLENKGINSRAQSNLEMGNILNTFTYGFEFDKQTSEVEADGVAFGEDEEARTIALYVENAIDFDNGFVFTPGIRYTNYQLDGLVGNINEDKLTYSLAAEYAVNDNLTFLASHTTLFKGVPMQEVFANYRTNVIENSDLKSETGNNNEIGFKYIQDNILGADQIGFSAKYYVTNIKNDIGYDSSYTNMINLGDTKTRGLEASFAYALNKFSGLLTYSQMDSNIELSGEPLTTQIGDKFTLNLKYQATTQLGLSWKSLLLLDEQDVNSDSYTDKKEGYAVHDIAVDYSPSSVKGLKVIAGIDNIFDKNYVSQSSIIGELSNLDASDYEPGRNFKVTLSYKF